MNFVCFSEHVFELGGEKQRDILMKLIINEWNKGENNMDSKFKVDNSFWDIFPEASISVLTIKELIIRISQPLLQNAGIIE